MRVKVMDLLHLIMEKMYKGFFARKKIEKENKTAKTGDR
jgi:hypothetical protein